MTIDKIGMDKEIEQKRKEKQIRLKEEQEEKALTTKMCDAFNKESKKQGSSYKMRLSNYAHLIKETKYFFKFILIDKGDKELNQIYFSKSDKTFLFIDGLPIDVFNNIEFILSKIPFKFDIRLTDGEIPAKYRIAKSLEEEETQWK